MLTTQKHEIYSRNKKIVLTLAALVGAVFLISVGIWIENKILDGAERKAQMYQTAIQTQNDREFNYSIDTQQGKILAHITVKSVDLVKFDEMNKEFVKVKKIKERYTQHERTVCETKYRTETRTRSVYDSTTESYSTETYTEEVPYEECHQETYYSWDEIDRWEKSAKEVDMAGRNYPIERFAFGMRDIDAKDIINGQTGEYVREEADTWIDLNWGDDEGDIRYGYEVLELPQSGTVFLNAVGGLSPVFGGKIVLSGVSAKQQVLDAQKAAQTQSTIFKVFWWIIVLGYLGAVGYWIWLYEQY